MGLRYLTLQATMIYDCNSKIYEQTAQCYSACMICIQATIYTDRNRMFIEIPIEYGRLVSAICPTIENTYFMTL